MTGLRCVAMGLTLMAMALPAQTTVQLGQTIEGELTDTDLVLETGEYVDEYILEGEAGRTVQIRLSSDDFDTFLLYRDGEGNPLQNDDLNGTNSGLDLVLSDAAPHGIAVTSFSSGSTGAYTLAITAGPDLSDGGPIAVGATVYGELDSDDPQSPYSAHVDTYTVDLAADQTVSIRLRSQDFDTVLKVVDPAGAVTDNDDFGAGTDSGVDFTASTAGAHTIEVSSFSPGIQGLYTLEIR